MKGIVASSRKIRMKKIVLTANDDLGLDGEMSMHFGHCTHFVVVQVDAANQVAATEVHPNPFAARHEPGQIPQYIGSLGADVVVAGGMGSKAIEWFRQFGIEVATGARSSVAETLDAYLAGAVAGAAQCRHEH
jgi:predicted Fe-Mo cluster-binding NifX family protein